MKYQLDRDRLKLWFPRFDIVWLPNAQPLDPVVSPAGLVPSLSQLERPPAAGRMFVVYSIDRLVEVLQAHAAKPEYWQSEPVSATRGKLGLRSGGSGGMGSR